MKRIYTTRRRLLQGFGSSFLSLFAAAFFSPQSRKTRLGFAGNPQNYFSSFSQSSFPPIQRLTLDTAAVTLNDCGAVVGTHRVTVDCFTETLGIGVGLMMVRIPAGSVVMGSPSYEVGRFMHEWQALVEMPSFFMGMTPITQAVYSAVMGNNLAERSGSQRFVHPHNPVVGLGASEAIAFCQALTQRTGRPYRLPTEAEWEYACRAGTTSPFASGATLTASVANYDASATYANEPSYYAHPHLAPVGQYPPNGFGLCDMHGNVWEWCIPHRVYPSERGVAASAPDPWGRDLVLRGGAWNSHPWVCRSATTLRHGDRAYRNTFGLRVVCDAHPETGKFGSTAELRPHTGIVAETAPPEPAI